MSREKKKTYKKERGKGTRGGCGAVGVMQGTRERDGWGVGFWDMG